MRDPPINVAKVEKIGNHNIDPDERDPLTEFFQAVSSRQEPEAALRAYLAQIGPRRYLDGLAAIRRIAELSMEAIERLYESIVLNAAPTESRGPRVPRDGDADRHRLDADGDEHAADGAGQGGGFGDSGADSLESLLAGPKVTAGSDVVKMLGSLSPNYRELRHVARPLATMLGIKSIPRAASRGNALLYLMANYAPPGGLALDDLVFAFETMNVFPKSDPENRRKVNWEINALQRKGWPISKNGAFYRLEVERRT